MAVNLIFDTNTPYTPPDANAVNFDFSPVITIPNSPAKDIAILLNDEGIAELGVNLFAYGSELKNNAQLVVIDTGGVESDQPQTYRSPTFQMLCFGDTGAGADDSYRLIKTAELFLLDKTQAIIQGTCYAQFLQTGDIAYLGKDENDRPVWSGNYLCDRSI